MHFIHRLLLGLGAFALLADDAMAAISGQIEARLVIMAGCEVTQASAPGKTAGTTASLDFGSLGPTWSTPLGSRLDNGNGNLAVSCSAPTTNPTQFTVTIDGGTQGDGSNRYLSNGSQRIPYHLSVDEAGNDHYPIGQQRTFSVGTGAWTPIPIHGALLANNQALPAGTYRDRVIITLNW
ncbi:Spore coat protein U (SCPU) domain-containing protein [Pseudomonas asplenii]|uniref:Spore coat protein U (SCPU) domain-containing protein n=1 Tax=Pseudomonas asplenii TaxID=53407 RepID=A0A1H1WLW5_9PSED|nr:spore coat protein U domain-containing protein [Pseudomonas asplenii]SDS98247.1 Spore coat protein U (SCPU) domain-containing protein [Pseudomonas asplenii]